MRQLLRGDCVEGPYIYMTSQYKQHTFRCLFFQSKLAGIIYKVYSRQKPFKISIYTGGVSLTFHKIWMNGESYVLTLIVGEKYFNMCCNSLNQSKCIFISLISHTGMGHMYVFNFIFIHYYNLMYLANSTIALLTLDE